MRLRLMITNRGRTPKSCMRDFQTHISVGHEMGNTELRDFVAAKLNAAIDLPLITEELEAIFFQRMVELLWRHVPKLAKDAILSGAALVDAGDLANVTNAIQSALLPRIKDLLWWRSDADAISKTVANTLLDIAKAGRSTEQESAEEAPAQA